jgi:hypothetical protein
VAFACNARPQAFSVLFLRSFTGFWTIPFPAPGPAMAASILMAIWVNLHGAFIVGLGLLRFLISKLFCVWLIRLETIFSHKAIEEAGACFHFALGATMANPETYKVYDYIRWLHRIKLLNSW